MKLIRIPLNYRIAPDPFDRRVGQLIVTVAGIAILPVAVIALIRHPGSRADFLLGVGLAGLVALLMMMLAMLCPHVGGFKDKAALRSRWFEVASYVACAGIMITGVRSLAGLGLTPVQVTLALLVVCSLSMAVLVLGMMTTLVQSLKG